MKKNHFLIFILFTFIFSSCEKIIQLDLKDSDPKIVIQAEINDSTAIQKIYISQSGGINDNTTNNKVNDAVVTLSDDAGQNENLQNIGDGLYVTSNFMGVAGRTYTLNVTRGGTTYTATSTMPNRVNLVRVFPLSTAGFFGGTDSSYLIVPIYFDPGNEVNYYRLSFYVNDTLQEGYTVRDDNITNGNYAQQPIFGQSSIKRGDTISVELMAINKNIFDYYSSLISNVSGTASPANPVSNFNNGALGYFSAQTKDTMMVIVE